MTTFVSIWIIGATVACGLAVKAREDAGKPWERGDLFDVVCMSLLFWPICLLIYVLDRA